MYGRNTRSTEAPMDFTFTSRPSSGLKPVWARQEDNDPSTPRKRTLTEANPPPSPFASGPPPPTFGANQNVPFIFQTPPRPTPGSSPYPWQPPTNFSPSRAFPQTDMKDVDMSDAERSPELARDHFKKAEMDGATADGIPTKEKAESRVVALGGLKGVFKARQKALRRPRRYREGEDDEQEGTDDEDALERPQPITQTTSNHYTLNMPGFGSQSGDLPYVLLGYLQFFFNLSLILVFLYLLIQFILTVQRDVEHRVSEYSMDVIQEIASCALQYRTNLCDNNPVPAMARQCASWKTCMDRDPTKLGRARVGAELIAEVVNGFVEPISWKTLAFTLTSLSFLTVFINTLLSLYRSKHNPPASVGHPIVPSFPGLPAQSHYPLAPHASPHPYPLSQPQLTSPGPAGLGWKREDGTTDVKPPARRRRVV